MKRKADTIKAAQCPTCNKPMEKIERRNDKTETVEILWRCVDEKCRRKL